MTFGWGLLAAFATVATPQMPPAQNPPEREEFAPAAASARTFPKYPPEALAAARQEIVLLDVAVDEAGQVTGVQRLYGKTEFAEVAEKAVRTWQFQPARRGKTPTADTVPVTIPFLLTDMPGLRFSVLQKALQDPNERVRLRVAQYIGAANPPLVPAECLALLQIAKRDESPGVSGVAIAYTARLQATGEHALLTGNWDWTKKTRWAHKPQWVYDDAKKDWRSGSDRYSDADESGTYEFVAATDGSFAALAELGGVILVGRVGAGGGVEATLTGGNMCSEMTRDGSINRFITRWSSIRLRGTLAGDKASILRLTLEGEDRAPCAGGPAAKLHYDFRRRLEQPRPPPTPE